jgi:ribosomal subunit interface protein
MDVKITARHCTVSDSVRQRASERLRRLHRYEQRITSAELIFQEEGVVKRAEARLDRAAGPRVIATGSGAAFGPALEQAMDRLARRLRRQREQQRAVRSSKEPDLAAR